MQIKVRKLAPTAQLVIVPYLNVQPIEADTLSDTERDNGGYGSTGQ